MICAVVGFDDFKKMLLFIHFSFVQSGLIFQGKLNIFLMAP